MKILFLGANGLDGSPLKITREVQQIRAEIERAQAKHRVELEDALSVTPSDLQRLLIGANADVVHFSGHGMLLPTAPVAFGGPKREFDGSDGTMLASDSEPQSMLVLEDEEGRPVSVASAALADLFGLLRTSRCIVLNACHSARLAEKIAEHVDCAIGMERSIDDRSAIKFAVGFYLAIVRGVTIRDAFAHGCAAIAIHGLPDADVPRFFARRPDLVLARLSAAGEPHVHTPTISELPAIPLTEDEQQRLERAVTARLENEPCTDSVRPFLQPFHHKISAPSHHLTVDALRPYPSLLARYYPSYARSVLPGYDGFDFNEFAAKYRTKIAHRCQDHRLLGLPPTEFRQDDLQTKIDLSSLFVPLRFRPDKDGAQTTSLVELLKTRKNVVVLGDPGMGKSMLLGFLALLIARGATLEGFAPSTPKTVPMPISLRDFVHEQKRQHTSLSFIEYLAHRAHTDHQLASSHSAFFDAALRMGEAIVLFDGLDEVGGDAARMDMASKIASFQDEYPHVQIWVTSRVYGYTKTIALPSTEFEHVRILDLDDEQVGDFLERWYIVQYPDNPRERDMLRRSLHDAVFHTSRVRRLAGCPLLLTLMAFIHRVLRNLPQDRAALYDQCIEMLLRSWQEARGREIESHPFEKLTLHVSTQKDYLAHLALFIQEKNEGVDSDDARGLIEREDALQCLTKRHFDVAGRSRTHMLLEEAREEMTHFLHYIGDRTGLLLDRGGGKLSFIHLAFQEYLAAWLFTVDPSAHDNSAFFKQHLGKQAWEEVLLLRLYVILRIQGGVGAFDAVTNAIFRELSRFDRAEWWLTLLRALRDNLDFTAMQQDEILKAAIAKWLEAPQLSGTWFAALKEVQHFSEKVAPVLRSHIAHCQANANGLHAIACLHLEADLFGLTEEAAARFRSRPDLSDLLPDLIAFMADPGIAALLSERATVDDWAAALSAFDGREAYGMTLGWATGALVCPVSGDAPLLGATRWMQRKIAEEAASRAGFSMAHAALEGSPSLFEKFSSIRVGDSPYQVLTPLAGAFVPQSPSWTLTVNTKYLFCPAAAAERVAETHEGTLPLEEALAASTEAWIEEWLCHFSVRAQGLPAFVTEFSRSFGGSFGRSFGSAFVRDFGRIFVWRFASRFDDLVKADFLRDFVWYFGRFFIRYFVRDFGRAFEADYGATYGLDFVRSFVIDSTTGGISHLGLEFGRHFGDQLHVKLDDANAQRQLEGALADKDTVHSLLQDDRFWDWLFFSVLPNVELSDEDTRFMHAARPENPFAIPLLLANLFTAAALQQIFCLGRHFAISSLANEYIADEAFAEWLLRHPVDVHPVAWSWDVHANEIEKNCNGLYGARGALAVVHADYAALMTGINVDETSGTWKTLLHERDCSVEGFLDDAVPTPRSTLRPPMLGADGPITQRNPDLPAVEVMSPVLSWIHISDLHFGHPDERRRASLSILSVSLRDEVCRHRDLGLPRVDAMFVAGDIAWNGRREQYDEAREYLLEMAGAVGLSPERVFLVPGNHDVDREKRKRLHRPVIASLRDSEGGRIEDILIDAEYQEIFAERQAAYLEFAAGFGTFCKRTPVPPPESRLYWGDCLQASDGRRVRVVGMNTALLAGEKDDRGKLHLGLASLRELLSSADEDELVILISHHPFSGGWLADEREVEREARGHTHLHLSGHVHDVRSEDHRRGGGTGTIRISAGATRTEPGSPPEYGYNVACVLPERNGDGYRVRIYPRRWSNRNEDFRTDVETLPRGCQSSWVEHEIPRIGRKRE